MEVCGDAIDTDDKPFKPTSLKVHNIVDALKAEANLPAVVHVPGWIGETGPSRPPSHELIACANGLLHVPTGELLASTPAFYTHNAVSFAYDPRALESELWLDFISQLWPEDQESRYTLQELFGYCLTPDTSQQKLFLLVGPKRSGKGTIGRVLRRIVGTDNVCAPTLASLSTNFGQQALINKSVALVADARLSARTDQAVIAERLLSMTGEDAQTVDRKFLTAWTGTLSTRFVISTNELPRLSDASGALVSRFIVLVLRHSFYGREDPGLTKRLIAEAPGIFNWALDGWRRLRERGHFVQPESAKEAVEALEALGSPLLAFVREKGYVAAPDLRVSCDDIYNEFCEWSRQQGHEKLPTKQSFGKDLHAVYPNIRTARPREEEGRIRYYVGIGR